MDKERSVLEHKAVVRSSWQRRQFRADVCIARGRLDGLIGRSARRAGTSDAALRHGCAGARDRPRRHPANAEPIGMTDYEVIRILADRCAA
jgi:hypothetical protein